jgi:ribosomal protein S18 acetylase RimI-like enzyme
VSSAVAVRPFRSVGDADWWAVRDLLVRSQSASPPGWNWDVRRWDGLRYHRAVPSLPGWLADGVGLWEGDDGRLLGVVHAEDGGDAFLELDPGERHLEPAMLDWAEARLAASQGGRRALELTVWDDDLPRRELLLLRGYEAHESGVWLRRLRFETWAIPVRRPVSGYRLRTTTADTLDDDSARMAALLNAAFGRTTHTAAEYRTFAMLSPSFLHDLNFVAEAPDGTFAAHVGLTLDAANRHGIIEPVCTHPDHRRHGLARALVDEALSRLSDLGAVTADVETGDMAPANALYHACGFTEAHRGHRWRTDLGPG